MNPKDISQPDSVQTCSGCGRQYLSHDLHTCPACGQSYCEKCYPGHNCQKPVPPPPNPHIALDQAEWYNKQPTPCDRCGKIVRADTLRKVGKEKLCPDCILKNTRTEERTKNTGTAVLILAIIGIVVFIILFFPGQSQDTIPSPTPVPTQATLLPTPTNPTATPTPTFNTAGTIHLTFPDISRYNPPILVPTGNDPQAEEIAADYNKWRGAYLGDMAEYQLHLANLQFDTANTVYRGTWTEYSLENDAMEKYRVEINRLGSSLNQYLDDYNSLPTTTTSKPSWRHRELPPLKPYN